MKYSSFAAKQMDVSSSLLHGCRLEDSVEGNKGKWEGLGIH